MFGILRFFALLVLLAALTVGLYYSQPSESMAGYVRARRQKVLRRHPVYGHMGSSSGVPVPVFEIAVAGDAQPAPRWFPCSQRAYHSVREGCAYRFLLRGGRIVRAVPLASKP